MFHKLNRPMTVVAAASAVAALSLTACGSGENTSTAMKPLATSTTSSSVAPSATSSGSTTSSTTSSTSSTTSSSTTTAAPKKTTRAAAPKVARSQARPVYKTVTETRYVAYDTVRRTDSSMARGTSKVTQQGVAGTQQVTLTQTILNGRITSVNVTKRVVTKAPVNRVLVIGTKVAAPKPRPTQPSQPTQPTQPTQPPSTGGLDLRRSAMWDRIAACESGGNWSINTGNGYYGGLQFSASTWLSSGGGRFAPRADLASRAQQITIANKLYDQAGLGPWGCAHAA